MRLAIAIKLDPINELIVFRTDEGRMSEAKEKGESDRYELLLSITKDQAHFRPLKIKDMQQS